MTVATVNILPLFFGSWFCGNLLLFHCQVWLWVLALAADLTLALGSCGEAMLVCLVMSLAAPPPLMIMAELPVVVKQLVFLEHLSIL